MTLQQLHLTNFRNLGPRVADSKNRSFDFSPQTTLVFGPNGAGKTNILEAIFLLAAGVSFRALKNAQMIRWEENFAVIEGKTDKTELKITLQEKNGATKFSFFTDNIQKTRKQFLENFAAVIFLPEDIRIISGSPSRRRDFLDRILSPINWQYRLSLSTYTRALRQRNMILKKIKEGLAKKEELVFWENLMLKNNLIIQKSREEFFSFANLYFSQHKESYFDSLYINYRQSHLSPTVFFDNFGGDLKFGKTSAGNHLDDFFIFDKRFNENADNQNLAFWGSRGQQRLAVFALKLAEIAFLEQIRGLKPVLLLDDIFSELDKKAKAIVASLLEEYQTVITSTEENKDIIFNKISRL